MLKLLIKKLSEHAVEDLLKRNVALQDENTMLRRKNAVLLMENGNLLSENAKFLGVVADKNRMITFQAEQLRGRDLKIVAFKRDAAGRFA
ncbi:MAG: hypothetical protein ABF968_04930 [Acetobacter sp.]|uniref:hypothetical protein n=1 Tax=Acetobacter sp. TaxID=440 RepID=UPI0039E737B2